MPIKDKAHRAKEHSFENVPPHQDRYPRGTGDDDWNLMSNACPIDSPKVASHPNDGKVLQHEHAVGFPVTNDKDSPNIFRSMTDGKGRK